MVYWKFSAGFNHLFSSKNVHEQIQTHELYGPIGRISHEIKIRIVMVTHKPGVSNAYTNRIHIKKVTWIYWMPWLRFWSKIVSLFSNKKKQNRFEHCRLEWLLLLVATFDNIPAFGVTLDIQCPFQMWLKFHFFQASLQKFNFMAIDFSARIHHSGIFIQYIICCVWIDSCANSFLFSIVANSLSSCSL